jgi:hypothetical protein
MFLLRQRAPLPVALAALALIGLVPRFAGAEPAVGAPLPSFSVRDLTEGWHNNRELVGVRTLVVAISGRDAAENMRHWFNNANARFRPGTIRLIAVVALSLPFYAPDGLVRGQARGRTPEPRWRETWLDRDGNLQRALGLPNDNGVPWAWVVDESGRVVAALHAAPDHPAAQQIWTALAPPAPLAAAAAAAPPPPASPRGPTSGPTTAAAQPALPPSATLRAR